MYKQQWTSSSRQWTQSRRRTSVDLTLHACLIHLNHISLKILGNQYFYLQLLLKSYSLCIVNWIFDWWMERYLLSIRWCCMEFGMCLTTCGISGTALLCSLSGLASRESHVQASSNNSLPATSGSPESRNRTSFSACGEVHSYCQEGHPWPVLAVWICCRVPLWCCSSVHMHYLCAWY